MPTNPYNTIIKDSENLAAAGDDASPTGIEFLDNLLYPNLQQRKEFGQQAALQQMQNEWSVTGKMEAMKNAGINANTAAAGIAGASSPSVGSPNSSVGTGAAATEALTNGSAGVVDDIASAYEKFSLTPTEKRKRKAETSAALEKAGLDKWSAKSIAELLPYDKENAMADFYLKLGNLDKVQEERKNLIQQRDNMKKEIDKMDEEIRLLEKQGNLVEAEKLRVEQQTKELEYKNWWSEADKQFWLDNGYRQGDPLHESLRNAIANGHSISVNDIGAAIEEYSYLENLGKYQADIDTAFDREFNKVLADKDLQAEYAPYLSKIEANKDVIKQFYQMLLENPSNIRGIVGKLITMLSSMGVANLLEESPVNNARKPVASPHKRK